VIGLGVSLLLGGGRRGLTRLLLVVAGVAVGVVFLLGALAIGPARDLQDARVALRQSPPGASTSATRPALLWDASRSSFGAIGGRPLAVIEVAATGPGAPLPLGASRVPKPGEVFVSPGLRRLLDSPPGRVYRLRFPGRIDGALGRAVLHDPNELVAMVGMPPGRLGGATRVTSWKAPVPGGPSTRSSFDRRLVYLLAALGVLIPIGVFIAASTRIGASTRERRFAALRLAGATPQQVATAAALEAAGAGLVGGVIGLVAALVLRTQAARFGIAGYAAFPADLSPPLWQVAGVLVATPVLAAAAALGSMRRVVVTPLGVQRRRPPRTPSARRLIPLVISWAELAVAVHIGDGLGADGKLAALGLGFSGVIVGIVIAGPWLVGALAAGIARAARGAGTLIAGRRLQASPGTAFRAVGGAVLGVFAATAVLVYLPSHDRWVTNGDKVAASIAARPVDATVNVYRNGAPRSASDALAARLTAIPGVRMVLPATPVQFRRAGFAANAVFGTCADARRVLHEALGCPRHGVLVARTTQLRVGDPLRIRGHRTTVAGYLPDDVSVSAVIPPGAVAPPAHPTSWLLETDGSLATAQRVRAAQTASGLLGDVETAAPDSVSSTVQDPLRRQAELAVALMLSIAGCSLVVMMIEGIVERRRELAMLAAAGTHPRALRTSVALEILIPLAVASVASCTVGVIVTATLLRVRGIGLVVPWADLAQLLAATAVVGAAVLGVGLPMLSRVIRPESLRTE
jgi:ABC-type antimicrobial peptide transport system permease subunit